MQIEYIDFQQDLFEEAVDETPTIYVSRDERAANLEEAARKYRERKKPFIRQSQFWTMSELKQRVFSTERITVREEKLSVLLFEILSDEEKTELNIGNYNEIIEFSSRFHEFFGELNEYMIESLSNAADLELWQQKRAKFLLALRERYLKELDRRDLTDKSQEQKLENFSAEPLLDHEKLVLINSVNLTPLERRLMKKIDKHIPVKIYLQMPPEDFCGEDLVFSGLSLEKAWPGRLDPKKINLFRVDDDTLQLLSALSRSDPETTFFTTRYPETNYRYLLPAERVNMPRKENFSRSKIYSFVEALHRILHLSPSGDNRVSMEGIMYAVCQPALRAHFSMPASAVDEAAELLRDNYIYVTSELVRERAPALEDLVQEIYHLREITSLSALIDYFDSMDLSSLTASTYKNDINQLYDSLLELSAIDEFDLVTSWQDYYDDAAAGLLDRLLQYIEFKPIEPPSPGEEPDLSLQELLGAPQKQFEHSVFLNAMSGWLPALSASNNFLLTGSQRRELGLPVDEDRKKFQRYVFYRHLLSSERADIFTLKNVDKNESAGPFLEEMRIRFDLPLKKSPFQTFHYPNFYNALFRRESNEVNEEDNGKEAPISDEDFSDRNLRLGYYKYCRLKDCYFLFLCQDILDLKSAISDFAPKLNALTFGSLVHDLSEIIMKSMDDDFDLDRERTAKSVRKVIEDYHLKIDHRFQGYYERIIGDVLVDSIMAFPEKHNSPLQMMAGKILDMLVEYSPDSKGASPFFSAESLDYYLGGRLDLFLKGEEEDALVDIKSSRSVKSRHLDQINYYALLLRQSGASSGPVRKYIYQILDKKFTTELPGTEEDFAETIKETLRKFERSESFERTPGRQCRYCDYKEICRVRDTS